MPILLRLHGARRFGAVFPALLLCAATTLVSPPASAQAPAAAPRPATAEELSTARAMFDDGLKAEDRGDFAGALGTYQRIAKITVSPVLLFRMAVCHGRLGHWVEAVNAFDLAALEADRSGRADVAAQARQGGAELRPKVPHLVVQVPADAQGVVLELDGRVLSAALIGTKILVDPGERKLTIRADNYADVFSITLRINEREEKSVRADLGAKRALPTPPAAPLATGPVAPGSPPEAVAATESSSSLPWILGGAALALGVGAGVTGLMAHDKHDQYQAANDAPTAGSLTDRTQLRDDGQNLALVSTLLTGAAIVSGGFAVYLFIDAKPERPQAGSTPRSAFVAPYAGPDGAGLVAQGTL